MLEWILNKNDWRVWTGLMCLRKGQMAITETGFSLSNLAFPVSSIPPMLYNYSFVSH